MILRVPLQVETAGGEEANHETICIDQGGNAMDKGVDTGTSPVNVAVLMRIGWIMLCSILNVNCACAGINEAFSRFTSVDFKTSFQHKDSSSIDRDDTTKIIKFLDNENPFEVNFATLHSLDGSIVTHDSGNANTQHS